MIQKYLRFALLILFIVIATIIPFPMKFVQKDKLPKNLVEQIDERQEEDSEEKEKS